MVIWLLPASIEFSTNSLTTLAGRSITSPAAIWLAKTSGNSIILLMIYLLASLLKAALFLSFLLVYPLL